jgi:hypothetical protein
LRQRIATLQREKSILEKAPGANPAAVEAAVAKQVDTFRKEIERNANQEVQKERDEQTKTNREWQVLLNAWIKYAEDLKKIITARSHHRQGCKHQLARINGGRIARKAEAARSVLPSHGHQRLRPQVPTEWSRQRLPSILV